MAGVVPQVAVVTDTDAGSNVNPARLGVMVKDCPNDTPLNVYRPFTSVTAVAVPAPDNVTVTPASAPSSRSRTRPEMAGAQAAVKSADRSVVRLAKDVEAGVNAYPVADGVTVKFPPIARFPRRVAPVRRGRRGVERAARERHGDVGQPGASGVAHRSRDRERG